MSKLPGKYVLEKKGVIMIFDTVSQKGRVIYLNGEAYDLDPTSPEVEEILSKGQWCP